MIRIIIKKNDGCFDEEISKEKYEEYFRALVPWIDGIKISDGELYIDYLDIADFLGFLRFTYENNNFIFEGVTIAFFEQFVKIVEVEEYYGSFSIYAYDENITRSCKRILRDFSEVAILDEK